MSLAVCKQGHIIDNHVYDLRYRIGISSDDSGHTYEIAKFCPECGAPVIVACDVCKTPIPSSDPILASLANDDPHSFCTRCGSPFPWASREARAGQLVALLEHEHLDDVVRLAAIEAIEELMATEPEDDAEQVRLATKLRRLAPGAWEWMRPVLQSVMTEAAKQGIGLA